MYGSFDIIKEKLSVEPMVALTNALENVMPVLETKARRVGGANYQVPVETSEERKRTLGIRWLINYARLRNEKSMEEKLAAKSDEDGEEGDEEEMTDDESSDESGSEESSDDGSESDEGSDEIDDEMLGDVMPESPETTQA